MEVTPSMRHLEALATVVASPVQGKAGGLEEPFARVFLRDVQLIKTRFCELLDDHTVPRNHLFLGETGVENKGITL
jgi:hypothetical protein